MRNIEVISVGQIVADVVIKPVNKLPALGSALPLEQVELKCGGCALNTAVALSKLGIETAFAGKVGRDFFGDFLLRHLCKTQLDISGIKKNAHNTTIAVVMISDSAERYFFVLPGGNESLEINDIDMDKVLKANILHIGGIMKLHALDIPQLLEKAKQAKITTSIDTDWDTTGQWLGKIESSLPLTDIFMSSIEEARMLSSRKSPDDICCFFLDKGVGICAIKMGQDGCYIKTKDYRFNVPAYETNVIDTTGAGDAFAAGFLAAYSKGWDLEKSGFFANACGALCVTEIGTTEGIQNFNETLEFMENSQNRNG